MKGLQILVMNVNGTDWRGVPIAWSREFVCGWARGGGARQTRRFDVRLHALKNEPKSTNLDPCLTLTLERCHHKKYPERCVMWDGSLRTW